MKKITISGIDLLELYKNSETKSYAFYIMENCKRSKYGYFGVDAGNNRYFYCDVSEKFLSNLEKIIRDSNSPANVSASFIIQVLRKLKAKPEEPEETDDIPF